MSIISPPPRWLDGKEASVASRQELADGDMQLHPLQNLRYQSSVARYHLADSSRRGGTEICHDVIASLSVESESKRSTNWPGESSGLSP